jgi:adenosine deaminase
LRPFVQVCKPEPDILAFFEKFKWQTIVMVNPEACQQIAYENVEDAAREGLDYIELRFSPIFMASTHNLVPHAVVEAVVEGVRAGERDFGIRANLIGIISRTYGVNSAWSELDALLTQHDHIVGLDLAGDEKKSPGKLFVEHFRKGRDAGWHITIHAGESVGPESVWQAINELNAERIGHAVHAPQDPRLMEHLLKHQVPIESNLTSNVQTSTVADYRSHPLRSFLEFGLCATINTDDPGISAIDLHYEYHAAEKLAGLSDSMIRQAQQNSLRAAFLSLAEKNAILKKHSQKN